MKVLSLLIIILFVSCNANDNSLKERSYNSTMGYTKSKAAIEDINFLLQRLEEVHYNPYLHISKEKLYENVSFLENKWLKKDSLMTAEFIIESMKLLSKIEDGHTKMVWYSNELLPQRDAISYFPVQIKLDKQKDLVINDSKFTQYKDDEVLEINKMNAALLYKEALQCLSSNFEHKNEIVSNLFFPIFLHLKGISAPYLIKLKSNQHIQLDSTESASFIDLYKRLQPTNANYEYRIMENEIGLISYNSCTDYEAFKIFLDTTFQKIIQDKVKDVIIDIRNNSGGNSALNDLLLAYITDKKYRQSSKRLWKLSDISIEALNGRGAIEAYGKDFVERYRLKGDSTILVFGEEELPQAPQKVANYFEGNCYLLIGPKTYSSANMLADAVSTYKLFTTIGMPTGEKTNDFGEQKTEYLPQSNIPFDYTIAFDVGANGDETIVKTVEPDIKVEGNALKYTINLILKKRENTEVSND